LTASALDPDFAEILTAFGIRIENPAADRPHLGFALEAGRMIVASVSDDSPAHASGLAPGDEILALNGLRVASDRWSDLVQGVAVVGQPLHLLTASRGVIAERSIVPARSPRHEVRLVLDDVDDERAALRRGWLRIDTPALAAVQQSPA
jgi:predicted metalloprotease with PDZ domain